MGDYIRWSPPYYEGADGHAPRARCSSRSTAASGRSASTSRPSAGKEVLLRLVARRRRAARVLPPGRARPARGRLRAAARARTRASSTARSPATARTGPNRDRSGHDMNYLGLNGLLGLTGDADGPPVQAGGPDRRPRRRRADGARSGSWSRCASASAPARGSSSTARCSTARCRGWRWSRPTRSPAGRRRAPRASCSSPARSPATGRTRAPTATSRSARWSRSSGSAWCRGVGREDLVDHAFDPPGSDAHARRQPRSSRARTREQWRQFASEHDCCLEPVLDLDEALESELVAAREMVVELEQPGAERPVKLLGAPVKLSRTPADPARAPGPGLGEHTDEVLAAAGFSARGDRGAARGRRGRGTGGRGASGSFLRRMSAVATAC